MKIQAIKILNYLGISVFKVDKFGKINKITGGNGVGKSAILKAIIEGIKGSGVDPTIIKIGEDESEIRIELDNKVVIERKITPDSNKVKVTDDLTPVKKPQAFLNGLLGKFNFNPVDFFQAKGRVRRELFLSAIPFELDSFKFTALLNDKNLDTLSTIDKLMTGDDVDFDQHGLKVLDDIKQIIYDTRSDVNSDAIRLKKSIDQDKLDLPETVDGSKYKNFKLDSEMEKLERVNLDIALYEKTTSDLKITNQSLVENKEKISALAGEIDSLQRRKETLNKVIGEYRSFLDNFNGDNFSLPEKIKADISEFQKFQKLQHRFEDIDRRGLELSGKQETHAALDELYKYLNNEVTKKILADMELPIPGITFSDDDILVNGVSMDNISTSEQMKIAVSIAKSLSGELKIICLDGFEALDYESRIAFNEAATDDDFEYFITTVTGGDLEIETGE